jgi:hypothetical protein
MATEMVIAPYLGGSTSTGLPVRAMLHNAGTTPALVGSWPGGSTAPASTQDTARRRSRERLAELREAAARRVRTMAAYDDTTDQIAERDAELSGWLGPQASTSTWSDED